ncbi:MAG: carbon storage regulator CsrA [Anaerolineae bacterium]|jgi:carbon storage regulator
MLLLSRRTGETIQIGDDISVTVLSVKGNQVRIGITAPDDVKIMRQELTDPKPAAVEC